MAEPVITDADHVHKAAQMALDVALADINATVSGVLYLNLTHVIATFAAAAVAADRAQRGADAQGTSINVNDLIAAAVAEREALIVADIALMMEEVVENWPPHEKVSTSIKLIAKTFAARKVETELNWNTADRFSVLLAQHDIAHEWPLIASRTGCGDHLREESRAKETE